MADNPYLNIDITTQPPQTPLPVVANTTIFTTEKPFDDVFRSYTSSRGVEEDFGTNSQTTKFAIDIFSQRQTIRTGGGTLYIAPMLNSVSATSGSFETVDISANLANFQATVDGQIRFSVDGENIDISDLNLTNITTYNDMIDIFKNLPNQPLQNVDFEFANGKLKPISKSVGTSSTITTGQVGSVTGTDLSLANYFDTANAGVVVENGVNATGETLQQAVTRLDGVATAPYYGLFTTTLQMEKDVIISFAQSNQAKRVHMFYYQIRNTKELDLADNTSLNSLIVAQKLYNTRIDIDSNTDIKSNLHVCALSLLGSTNWNGTNTHLDLFWKGLSNAVPSNILKIVDLQALGAISRYVNTGEFLDAKIDGYSASNALGLIWLLKTIEARIFNLLKTTSTKIPQTEEGVQRIKNEIVTVLRQSVTVGLVAPNTWNGEVPYDDEKFRQGIAENGFYIRSVPISEQSQADREAGKAPLINFAFKYAGAIIDVSVIGLGQF